MLYKGRKLFLAGMPQTVPMCQLSHVCYCGDTLSHFMIRYINISTEEGFVPSKAV